MKKYTLFLIMIFATVMAFAQSSTPRFGTTPGKDNTGRVLTYNLVTTADVAGNDSLRFTPNAWETILRPSAAIIDSVNIRPRNNNARLGDNLYVFVSKGSGAGAIRFPSAFFINDSAANRYTIGANKTAVFHFKFNGSKWQMVSKKIEP